MSREELGDAVVDDAVDAPTPLLALRRRPPGPLAPLLPSAPVTTPTPAPPAPPAPGPDDPATTPGTGDRRTASRPGARLVILLVVTALSATAGFAGMRAWSDATTGDTTLSGDPVAWAVIVDVRPAGGVSRSVVDLGVRLDNLGRVPVTIIGSETTPDAGAVEAIAPDSLKVQAGRTAELQVHASVDCASPQPLRLYPLQVRRSDQTVHSIEITGGPAALAQLCESQPATAHVLVLGGVTEDDGHLRLTVNSPTGRTTQILRLRAAGVTLVAQPLRGSFDAHDRAIWLQRPRSCPTEWLRGGLPRTVTVDVDAGGPATVTLDVGYALARWLRSGPCSGQGKAS